jgi:hypothetical protein
MFAAIENIQIKVVNSSKSSEKLEYPKNDSLRVIAIGGLALSRGLTLEGLVVSYFYRNTCTYDVLMQMGRWFGYRKKYELLPRLWITDKTRQQFAFLAALDQELRDEIQHMDITGRSPADYGPKVKNSPKVNFIRITAKNRMQAATEAAMDYSGASNQTYLFDNNAALPCKNFPFARNISDKSDLPAPLRSLRVRCGISYALCALGIFRKSRSCRYSDSSCVDRASRWRASASFHIRSRVYRHILYSSQHRARRADILYA